jgi:hypothetical protein
MELFELFFLRAFNWKICTRHLKMDRGKFFHQVYVVEQLLGRAYRDTKPYGLWPLREYFAGERRDLGRG